MIELKNVTKMYGNFKAVDHVNLKIEKGEVVGLLGQNGAGKTTTLKLITGLIAPTEGEIYIDGEKLSEKSKRNIGYMSESTPLYQDLKVKEFLNYMAELKKVKNRKECVNQIIVDLGLENVKNTLIKNISRGYKQRTSMAGALIGNPEIVILDEPTVGLDPKQIIEIRNFIKSLRKTHTVILSTHILSEVSNICEKVIIIDNGRIIAEDTPEKLEDLINNNSILISVEDKDESITKIKEKIPDIIEIKLDKKIDNTKRTYEIIVKKDIDIREKLFEILPKYNIKIIELKKSETSLEDAFIKLIQEKGGKTNVGNN